jgi:hypothetical protein
MASPRNDARKLYLWNIFEYEPKATRELTQIDIDYMLEGFRTKEIPIVEDSSIPSSLPLNVRRMPDDGGFLSTTSKGLVIEIKTGKREMVFPNRRSVRIMTLGAAYMIACKIASNRAMPPVRAPSGGGVVMRKRYETGRNSVKSGASAVALTSVNRAALPRCDPAQLRYKTYDIKDDMSPAAKKALVGELKLLSTEIWGDCAATTATNKVSFMHEMKNVVMKPAKRILRSVHPVLVVGYLPKTKNTNDNFAAEDIVAAAICTPRRVKMKSPNAPPTYMLYIEYICSPRNRCKGGGAALMDRIASLARNMRYIRYVALSALHEAMGFYESRSLIQQGWRKGWPGGVCKESNFEPFKQLDQKGVEEKVYPWLECKTRVSGFLKKNSTVMPYYKEVRLQPVPLPRNEAILNRHNMKKAMAMHSPRSNARVRFELNEERRAARLREEGTVVWARQSKRSRWAPALIMSEERRRSKTYNETRIDGGALVSFIGSPHWGWIPMNGKDDHIFLWEEGLPPGGKETPGKEGLHARERAEELHADHNAAVALTKKTPP